VQKGHAFRREATEEKIQVDSRIIGYNDVAEFRVNLDGEGKSRRELMVMASSLVSQFVNTGDTSLEATRPQQCIVPPSTPSLLRTSGRSNRTSKQCLIRNTAPSLLLAELCSPPHPSHPASLLAKVETYVSSFEAAARCCGAVTGL